MRHDNGTKIALGAAAALAGLAALASRRQRPPGSRSQDLIPAQKRPPWEVKVPPPTEAQVKAHMNRDKAEELLAAIEDERGFYGTTTRNGGIEDAWSFNIKVYPSVPDWVSVKLGDEGTIEHQNQQASDEIDFFLEMIQDDEAPLYQPWFSGNHSIAGRSGGYLVLDYGLIHQELDNLLEDFEDNLSVTLGGKMVISDPDFKDEFHDAVYNALDALNRRAHLEKAIKDMTKEFEQRLSSDEYWAEVLDISEKDVKSLKARTQAQPRRRW